MVCCVQRSNYPSVFAIIAWWYVLLGFPKRKSLIVDCFTEPNNNSPLNVDAANSWSNAEEFKAHVTRHYRPIVENSA
jgi:hypothetical protein